MGWIVSGMVTHLSGTARNGAAVAGTHRQAPRKADDDTIKHLCRLHGCPDPRRVPADWRACDVPPMIDGKGQGNDDQDGAGAG
jgi:hypothetical protein